MSDDLQIIVIVVNFKTFNEYLLLIIVVLKNKLMLQTFHQTIECKKIDANFLSKQFRAMFEIIQNHIKIHRNFEYKSKKIEISKLIDMFHDLQRFFDVFIFHELVERFRRIEKIQIFCKFVDKIDENIHDQQNLNAQFEIDSTHVVYVKKILASIAKQQQLKIVRVMQHQKFRIFSLYQFRNRDLTLDTYRDDTMSIFSFEMICRYVSRSIRIEERIEAIQRGVTAPNVQQKSSLDAQDSKDLRC